MYKPMITNVSIKFNSIEEYREIESKLIELGYKNNPLSNFNNSIGEVKIREGKTFTRLYFTFHTSKVYNNLQEFLNDK